MNPPKKAKAKTRGKTINRSPGDGDRPRPADGDRPRELPRGVREPPSCSWLRRLRSAAFRLSILLASFSLMYAEGSKRSPARERPGEGERETPRREFEGDWPRRPEEGDWPRCELREGDGDARLPPLAPPPLGLLVLPKPLELDPPGLCERKVRRLLAGDDAHRLGDTEPARELPLELARELGREPPVESLRVRERPRRTAARASEMSPPRSLSSLAMASRSSLSWRHCSR